MEFFFIICKINIVIHVVKSYLLCCIVEVLGCANLDSFCHEIYDDLKPRLFGQFGQSEWKQRSASSPWASDKFKQRHEEIRKFPPFPELEVFCGRSRLFCTHIQRFHATTMHHHGWDFITCWLHANVQWFRFWLPSWKLSQLKSSLAPSSVEGVWRAKSAGELTELQTMKLNRFFACFGEKETTQSLSV